MNRVVVVYRDDESSNAAIRAWAAHAEVVAVVVDLWGHRAPLAAMRDAALAAGATRCHVIDGADDFLRHHLLPALRARTFPDPHEAYRAAALAFLERQEERLAAMEGAVPVSTDGVPAVPAAHTHARAGRVDVAFADGLPVSVNGVEMALTELLESVETISGESALHVLDREYARRATSVPTLAPAL